MTSGPVNLIRSRLRWERLIWFIDMAAYLFIAGAGILSFLAPSPYLQHILDPTGWLAWLWISFLVVGGLGGFIGRVSRLWVVEFLANGFAGWGVFLYLVILAPGISDGGPSAMALATVVFVAWSGVVRRYSELQIIASDPRVPTLRAWIVSLLKRRTKNTVERQHH